MAVRDVTDEDGVPWKIWAITPDQLRPRTSAEDYLGEYGEGWLCFESPTERRRLSGYPTDWESLPVDELLALLRRAAHVSARRSSHLAPFESEVDRQRRIDEHPDS